MGPKSRSGFYLSRPLALLLALLLVALMLALVVLAALYARSQQEAEAPAESAVDTAGHTTAPSPVPTKGALGGSTASGSTERPGIWDQLRLPPSPVPVHYQLELWPRLEPDSQGAFAFSGQVNITMRCLETEEHGAVLLLHSLALNVSASVLLELAAGGERELGIERLWHSAVHDYLVLELAEPLRPGLHYLLRLHYHGHLSQELVGLFVSRYRDQDQEKVIVASQLEPTYARAVYPCFDEPAMKATFDTRIVHPPTYVALSNMPAISVSEREDDNGTKWSVTTFNTTVTMSTYITAFVVCDFDNISRTDERGHEIRIWARKQVIQNGYADYALNITGPILRFLEELLNVSYPLQKTDLVALPDFGAGAMENWGLMTFQEYGLTVEKSEKQAIAKASISLIVSHELGHQWFGNLVTMKWWNDIWLNEGFATYMEYIGASFIDHTLSLNEIFHLHNLQDIFRSDDLISPRTVSVKKEDILLTNHISPLFDMITYSKGASFVRMMSSFLTEKLFTKGLSSYLKTFAFSNADQDDLWSQFQMVLDEQNAVQLPMPIKHIMESWTWQKGIPLLTLNTTTGIITEEQFYQEAHDRNVSHDNHTWIVPISWMKNGHEQPLIWLDNRSKAFPELQTSSEHEWIILNINVTGYYRTNYDQQNWRRIMQQLDKDPTAIPVVNRVQLIEDAFAIAEAGYLDIETALSLTKYLAKEEELIVWHAVRRNILFARQTPAYYTSLPLWKKYMFRRIAPVYHYYESVIRSNFDEKAEDYFVQAALEGIISAACSFGLQECLHLARDLFSKWLNDPANNEIPSSIRETIYCYGIATGSEKEWDSAWALYNKTSNTVDSHNLLYGLSCTKEPWLLNRYLQYAINLQPSAASEIFRNVLKNEIGRHIAWEFITTHWEHINKLNGTYKTLYDVVISAMGARAVTEIQVQEIELFINTTMSDNDDKQSAMEVLQNARDGTNTKWFDKMNSNICDWLQKNTDVSEF
ncbi:aminopeptidase Q [Ambystoma mexicanum]|uniref:aminopeptidase Q n=1 Tax=Ambystoma mexicanum TaxID=8296 RepID=UPI0037E78A17